MGSVRWTIWVTLLGVCLAGSTQAEGQVYRMCVPIKYLVDCMSLLEDPSEAGIQMRCVAGRDRMDCLSMIQQRRADVLATEPEDMYVAYHSKNADYRVISEIRSQDDKDADFRYEGIILVKKNSNIHNLLDLRGAKSCHTGFGRNVGYKIPITKLKKSGVLKVSMDPEITANERELKSLSEFFSESCLVGKYSPSPDTDRLLKKKYSNLCALCEKPEQCDYPDKFSGYDGAIRCLDKGKGDVAFSKVQYVKKYFGLIPGNTAEGDASEFEYLCENGTRRPLNGPACSWAQRPWIGYISNIDNVATTDQLHKLQKRLETFFTNGLHSESKVAANHLLIKEDAFYHSKPEAVEPKAYLESAGYKDVIERDGSEIRKMKLCVKTDIEMSKCDTMKRAAYSREVRPELECVQEKDCLQAVKTSNADIAIVRASEYKTARDNQLKPIAYESNGPNNVYVAIVEPSVTKSDVQTLPVHYDANNERARLAATFLNKRRGLNPCEMTSSTDQTLTIVNSKDLEQYRNKQLLCPNMERQPVTAAQECNFEVNLPVAAFIRTSMTPVEQETMKHLFLSLSAKFGAASKIADVFTLFGEYGVDQNNILFSDAAVGFVTELENPHVSEEVYNGLQCDTSTTKRN